MKLIGAIQKKLSSLTRRITVVDGRFEPESWTEWLDVDRVGMAIRAARGGSVQLLFALYRDIVLTDSHIQAEMFKRKLAVLGDPFSFTPYDKDQPADVAAASLCESMVYDLRGSWRVACGHLLDSVLWPVAVVEKLYRPEGGIFRLSELIPVPHHLLDFSTGRLMIRDTDDDGQPLDTLHCPIEERYIVHRGHLLTTPDNYGGPMRSLIYWWLGSMMSRDWWARFLDRYGMPFLVGKYEPGNTSDRNILMGAFSAANKVFGLAISKNTEVEVIEAQRTGADCFNVFVGMCNREKSKLILGQTLSAQTDATGMGSGVADLQSNVRDDIRTFDGALLAETLRWQLFEQAIRLAGQSGEAPTLMWGAETAGDLKVTADLLASFNQAGIEVDDPGIEVLSERSGIPLRRRAGAPAYSQPFMTMQAEATQQASNPISQSDDIAASRSAALSHALRSFPAEVARIIRESRSAAECMERIEALYANHDHRPAAHILEDALALHAAIAISEARTP